MIITHLPHKRKPENLDRLRFKALYSTLTRYVILSIFRQSKYPYYIHNFIRKEVNLMLRKLLRAILALLGALIGYGVYRLLMFLLENFGVEFVTKMTTTQQIVAMSVTALLFGFIFFRLTPLFTRQGHKVADNIQSDLQGVSGNDMLTGVVGLIIGLVIAFLLSQIYAAIDNRYIYLVVTVITYLIMGYLGVVIATQKGKEIFAQILSQNRQDQQDGQGQGIGSRFGKGVGKSKKNANQTPKILDTSVIIDGRISEIMKTGFLEALMYSRKFRVITA